LSPKKNVTWYLKPYNYSPEVKENELLNEVRLTMEEIINDNDNDNYNEEDDNIFKLLKKVPTVKSETTVKS
jgi:hypothetical protein